MESRYELPESPVRMLITPEVAHDWRVYRAYEGNRKISQDYVDSLAYIMLEPGAWNEHTHQGIAFDTEGKLLDGQQRLAAIEAAGVSKHFWVFPNLPRSSFAAMDVGRKRRASDFMDVRYARTVASSVRYIIPVLQGDNPSEFYGKNFTMERTIEMAEQWPELGYWVPKVIESGRQVGISPGPLTAIVAMGQRAHGDVFHIQGFLDGIRTGANLESDDPRLHLRNRFLQARYPTPGSNPTAPVRGNAQARTRAWVYVVKSFKHWMDDRAMGRLIWQSEKEGVPAVWRAVELRRENGIN